MRIEEYSEPILDRVYTDDELVHLEELIKRKQAPVDFRKIAAVYGRFASQGHAIAQYNLGKLYQRGLGFESSKDHAAVFFRKAAIAGLPEAQFCYGDCIYGKDTEAVAWIRKAADQNISKAQYLLGKAYKDGYGVKRDYEAAAEWFRKAAGQEESALYELAELYWCGKGVEKNQQTALELYRKAAEQGILGAQLFLGDHYCSERSRNFCEAAKWYKEAAEQGDLSAYEKLEVLKAQSLTDLSAEITDPVSQWLIGMSYQYRLYGDEEDNTEQALKWYQMAAAQGDPLAMDSLGGMYRNGEGLEIDYGKAEDCFRKAYESMIWPSIAYELGKLYEKGQGVGQSYSQAAFWYKRAGEYGVNALAELYKNGQGVEKDYNTAARLYLHSAKKGDAEAFENLNAMAESGFADVIIEIKDPDAQCRIGNSFRSGPKKDIEKAAEWYRKAIEQGSSVAAYEMGRLYEWEYNDYQKAAEWYRKAAESGFKYGAAQLGRLYEEGKGVEQDHTEAARWYEAAGSSGCGDLGLLYKNGLGVSRDYDKAFELLQYEADLSDYKGDIQTALGDLYRDGLGVDRNYYKAAEYYQKAAGCDEPRAQYELGLLYEKGLGVKQDINKAIELYEDAWGIQEAAERLRILTSTN